MSATLGFIPGVPGHLELLIIGFVILLLFGHRLPSLMRSLGSGVVEFKRGLHEGSTDEEEEDKSEKHVEEKA